jgi:hypothetical protein
MPDTPIIDVNVRSTNTITISRKEYDELKKALFVIDAIGTSISKYGVDDRIALPLLKSLGYTPPEEEDDA